MYVNYHAHVPMMFWIGKGIDKKAGPNADWVESWWNPYIEPIESILTKEDISILSEACALVYLEKNITEVWDMYFFEEEVVKSLSKHGIKVYSGEAIMTNPPTGYKSHDAITETERLIKKFKDNKLVEPVVGYIGPYDWASNKELTKASVELARKYKRPVHMHGAGNNNDFEDCKRIYGMMPIETMEHFGFFREEIPEVVIAHCAVLHPKEIEILKHYKEKIKIAVCPRTTYTINYPLAPVKELIQNDIQVVLGTDGASPCGIPDIKKEMQIAAKTYKVPKEYFERSNESKLESKTISSSEREQIIKKWKACLESLAKRANLKRELREEFLKSTGGYDKF